MLELTSQQKNVLLNSPYVKKITSKNHVAFTDEFKKLVVKQIASGKLRKKVFLDLLEIDLPSKYIDTTVKRWRSKIQNTGSFKDGRGSGRGRKKLTRNMTVEEMEAEIAYQKEVIKQLKKIHGLADDELYPTN
jgi:hypothetical protein